MPVCEQGHNAPPASRREADCSPGHRPEHYQIDFDDRQVYKPAKAYYQHVYSSQFSCHNF